LQTRAVETGDLHFLARAIGLLTAANRMSCSLGLLSSVKRGVRGEAMIELEFTGQLERGFRGWIGVRLPASSPSRLGTKAQVAVAGSVNGHPIITTVQAAGDGRHFLALNQALRASLQVTVGDVVQVRLRPAPAKRPVGMPDELRAALETTPEAEQWWQALSPGKQRVAATWISHAKGTEVRAWRASDVLRRARRAFVGEGPFYPTQADQPLLGRPRRPGGSNG
jgi:Domain of unknown function (DUF1905)/Bacteriocin-protection, YdeI or OmpD-Associated